MTRPKEFTEQLAFLVAEGTKERVEAVRGDMLKSDFFRMAIEEAIVRAERSAKRRGG